MVREGSLVVVPRDSVVEREEAKEDCWENNTGIAEAEGASPSVVDETPESYERQNKEHFLLRPRETVIGAERLVSGDARCEE